jgi:hypothetical protein
MVEVEVPVDPKGLAEMFCGMDDEKQAQFFIEAAAIASKWEHGSGMQWYLVGRHLKNCGCSTIEARDMVQEIARSCEP